LSCDSPLGFNKMVMRRNELKFFALTIVSVLFVAVFAYSASGLGLVVRQESIVLSDSGGACLNYELFNSKPGAFTAGVSVSDGLTDVFASGASPEIPGSTARDEAIPVEVCFQTPSDLAGCSGDDVDFIGNVIFSEGGTGSGTGSVATLSVPVPMTVRVDCSEGSGSGFSLLWFIIALILLIIVILLFVKRSQAQQMGMIPMPAGVKRK